MNTMMFLRTRVINGRVCALDPSNLQWAPISAAALAVNGCLFRLPPW